MMEALSLKPPGSPRGLDVRLEGSLAAMLRIRAAGPGHHPSETATGPET